MNLYDLTDEEINRAQSLLVREHRALAKVGIVGTSEWERVLVGIWVVAALLRDKKDKDNAKS